MNVGTRNIVYDRRKALFTRSNSSYIQMRLDSRDAQDSDEEWDASSSSAISAKSSKSLKSFKSWKRSQREKRRNLKKTKSLGHDSSESTLEALDLSGDYGTSIDGPVKQNQKLKDLSKTPAIDIDDGSDVFPDEAKLNQLATIAQSPVEAYYSSSPLTTSSEDSDTPASLPHVSSEIDEPGDVEDPGHSREPKIPQKDLLNRRSYPFILPEIYSQDKEEYTEISEPPTVKEEPRYLITPTTLDLSKIRTGPPTEEGLNSALSLPENNKGRPPLLSLAIKSRNPSMDEPAYGETGGKTDVVFADKNGFTVSLPSNSPSISAHMLDDDTFEREELSFTKEEEDKNSKSEEQVVTEEVKTDKKDTSRRYWDEESDLRKPELFFLPPLIARAMSNKSLDDLGIGKADKNANVNSSPVAGANKPKLHSTGSSTEEECEEENVYLENADDIFHDMTEKDFLGVPRTPATQENLSDDGSAVTQESADPIENILTREDDVTADNRTFTLNGRAVITPNLAEEKLRQEKMEKDQQQTNGKSEDISETGEDAVNEGTAETKETEDIPSTSSSKKAPKQADVSDMCPDLCCAIL